MKLSPLPALCAFFTVLVLGSCNKTSNPPPTRATGTIKIDLSYPESSNTSLSPKIELCLGSFATGERAKRKYSNGGVEEEGEPTTTAPTAY